MNGWFAIYSKFRHERKVASQLSRLGITNFLPLSMSLRQWKDRKKWLEMPVFPNYLFVNCVIEQIIHTINHMPGVISVVGYPKPDVIPNYQIEGIRKILLMDPECQHIDSLLPGDEVLIVRGPLKGVRGKLVEKRGMNMLVVHVELINQGLSTIVNLRDVIKYSSNCLLPCSVINYESPNSSEE